MIAATQSDPVIVESTKLQIVTSAPDSTADLSSTKSMDAFIDREGVEIKVANVIASERQIVFP